MPVHQVSAATADAVRMPELPQEVVAACRLPADGPGYRVVRGLTIDDSELGPTPDPTVPESFGGAVLWSRLLAELAVRLGSPLVWAEHQGGRVVTDVAPSPHRVDEQSGAGSAVTLQPHTEDAFHPDRCHLLILAGLRNPDAVPTLVSSTRDVRLPSADWDVLCSNGVPVVPDADVLGRVRAGERAPRVATVWRGDAGFGLRCDPVHTPIELASPRYQRAYTALTEQLLEVRREVVVGPGELLILDNDVVVHGRAPFRAGHDGRDRWLKRVILRVAGRHRPPAVPGEDGYGEKLTSHPAERASLYANTPTNLYKHARSTQETPVQNPHCQP